GLTALLLWAPWHPPSVHLTKVLDAIAAEQKSVRFGKANTDVCASLATSLGASQVPFAAFFDPRGRKVDSLAGADPPRLLEKAKALATRPFVQEDAGGGEVEAGDLHSRRAPAAAGAGRIRALLCCGSKLSKGADLYWSAPGVRCLVIPCTAAQGEADWARGVGLGAAAEGGDVLADLVSSLN
ncbi:unnamed protein product, partial [Prorocentrum cordatum]